MARGKIFGALVHKRAEESNPVEEPKATERPPLPCFSGFGLPRCSQVSATGWDGDSTAGFAVKDDFFCLQCCSDSLLKDPFDDAAGDHWKLRCAPGDWRVTVAEDMLMRNPFTQLLENVTAPAGVGVGQAFTRNGVPMPPREDGGLWEFRFLRRETEEGDRSEVRCPLSRVNASQWISGYELQLTVGERRNGQRTWSGVTKCSARALEQATQPAFLDESITMVQTEPPPAGVAVGAIIVVAGLLALAIASFFCPCMMRRVGLWHGGSGGGSGGRKARVVSDDEVLRHHDRVNHLRR